MSSYNYIVTFIHWESQIDLWIVRRHMVRYLQRGLQVACHLVVGCQTTRVVDYSSSFTSRAL